jgi:predicted lipoprotein with Yx(FWY)xxD motif
MPSNNRSHGARTAVPGPWVIATAAALGMLAVLAFLLLSPAVGNAARGHTLYQFEKDRNGKSACTGMCAQFWPPLIASGKPQASAGAKASLLGTTRRADGRMQVTYKSHPLYTFVKDTKKGQTNGEGLTAFGAQWFANSSAGAKVVKHTAPAGPGYGP